jgi:hypothetical protein
LKGQLTFSLERNGQLLRGAGCIGQISLVVTLVFQALRFAKCPILSAPRNIEPEELNGVSSLFVRTVKWYQFILREGMFEPEK